MNWFAVLLVAFSAPGPGDTPRGTKYTYDQPFVTEAACVDFLKSEHAKAEVKIILDQLNASHSRGSYKSEIVCEQQ